MCLDLRRLALAALAACVWSVPAVVDAGVAQASPVVRDVTVEIACAPQAAFVAPVAAVRIAGGEDRRKRLFGTNDAVVLNAGTAQGLRVGQEYYVRRVVDDRFTVVQADGVRPLSIHTAGRVRVVDTATQASIAVITTACDGVLDGDYLEPFTPPALPLTASALGEADYANPGHLILGDDRRQIGGAGSMMVLNRGSDHGVRPGQRLTIFRETGGGPVFRVGQAVVITTSPETALIRIDSSKDAVYVGDLVAIHR
jgi:hypothetical protein